MNHDEQQINFPNLIVLRVTFFEVAPVPECFLRDAENLESLHFRNVSLEDIDPEKVSFPRLTDLTLKGDFGDVDPYSLFQEEVVDRNARMIDWPENDFDDPMDDGCEDEDGF